MQPVSQLGQLNGPLLVFGGPYSNLAATNAMREEAERLAIPPDHIICTGDIVAYCAEASETLEMIRDWGVHVVQGNCEESLGNESLDCGCGFDEGSSCSLLSIEWYNYANRQITAEQRHWMADLPSRLDFSHSGLTISVVHGSTENISEFIFPSTSEALMQNRLAATSADVVIGGHCGLPFGKKLKNGYWLNSGVIGMPANDGTPDVWYMLLTPDSHGLKASWHRLSYDAELSQRRMNEVALCAVYAEALTSGKWPSDTILPESDHKNTSLPKHYFDGLPLTKD